MVFLISSPKMLKMVCFVSLLCSLLGLTDAGQENVKLLNFLTNPSPLVLQSLSHTGSSVAVSVDSQHLNEISSSVLMAETWLRTHVLTHFPSVKITTIVIGNTVLCKNNNQDKWDLVLPSVKNIYHSLVRWGLENEIKVSVAFSDECLHPFSYKYREDLAERIIKPLLNFLQKTNSSFSVNGPPDFSPLVTVHTESIKKLGDFKLSEINVLISTTKETKPKSRKLSFLSSNAVDPFPARPTPLPTIPPSPIHSSIGFSVPAHIAKTPLPPLTQTPSPPSMSFPLAPQSTPLLPPLTQTPSPPSMSFPSAPQSIPPLPPLTQTPSPPSMSFPFTPESPPFPPFDETTPTPSMSFSYPPQSPPIPPFDETAPTPSKSFSYPPQSPPLVIPSNPPDVHSYPPCYRSPAATPPPRTREAKGLWCVAKPSVPEEKLQEAIDYACGVGGADCEEIRPHGSCYYPDTMVAHASYAYNSYWQKNKNNGGSCSFGGTAMVINADPSFLQCRFILS